jgi:riboflavin synthase
MGDMFTGIVEELGTVEAFGGGRLQIRAAVVLSDAQLGSSIAVNGCCLTVVELDDATWTADVSDETLRRTSLGSLAPGDPVNLERPLALGARLGGHVVQGHVDAVGTVVAAAPALRVAMPAALARYVVEKGSITVDGVSLTVTEVADAAVSEGTAGRGRRTGAQDGGGGGAEFGVAVIPHTAAVTTLGSRGPGDPVNLEVDVLAKYVERLLGPSPHASANDTSGASA